MNTSNKEFTEKDWKLFRSKIVEWQENYMNKLNEEYIAILTQDKNPSEKFWQLYKNIKKDVNKPGVIIDMRRSVLIENIIQLLRDGVIQMESLNEFSEVLQDTIHIILRR